MGRKRMFTSEVYEALQSGIAEDSVWGSITDFFSNISLRTQNVFSQIELEEDFSNMNSYLHDISDLNNYTEEKLKEIFLNVEAVDKRYEGIFLTQAETMNSYKTVIDKLTEAIGNKDFENSFDETAFLSSLSNGKHILLQTKWEEILSKPANEITQEEYLEAAELLVRVGDAELLEDMLNECYEYSDVEGHTVGYITVDVVSYQASEKLENLAKAVELVQDILVAQCIAENGGAQTRQVESAIQFNQLLQTFLPMSEALDIATTTNVQGEWKTSIDRLIEIEYNENGVLEMSFCQYPGENQVWIEQQQTVIAISPVVTGQSGESRIYDESFQYMADKIGTESWQSAVTQESISQILSACYGEIPGSGIVSAVEGIVMSGVNASQNEAVVEQCESIADLGVVADQFQLTYVSADVDGDVSSHAFSFYPSETTVNWVQAFNEYMQNGSGAKYKQGTGYNDLPEGELTVQYILECPDEVAEMLAILNVKRSDYSETEVYDEEMRKIYEDIKK